MTISVADGVSLPTSEEPAPPPGGVPGYNPSSVLEGGRVIWLGGYDFLVTAARYQILGVTYESPDTEVTLSTAHATLDRFDVFAVNNTNSVVVVEGTNAADPVKPDIDPATQLELTWSYIEAATGPVNLTNTIIYSGEGGDWTAADNTANINLASTNNPHSGTVCVEGTSVVAGNYFEFTAGAAFDLNIYNSLVLYIRLKAVMSASKAFILRWFNSTTARGVQIVLSDGQFNFDRELVGVYQAIVIPTLLFDTNGFTVDKLRYTIQGGGGSVGFYFDDCSLQGGLVLVDNPSSAMVYRGNYSATAQYNTNDVVTHNGLLHIAPEAILNEAPGVGPWVQMMSSFMVNPMTTGGDIIYGGASGVATRLANGTAGYALVSAGGTSAPTWAIVRDIPQNSQSAAYTTVLTDAGKHLLHPAADTNARTFTIDSNANVPYPVGTAITFVNETANVLSIAITSDTLTLANTTTSGTRSLAQNGIATALKVTTTKWIISGTGLT